MCVVTGALLPTGTATATAAGSEPQEQVLLRLLGEVLLNLDDGLYATHVGAPYADAQPTKTRHFLVYGSNILHTGEGHGARAAVYEVYKNLLKLASVADLSKEVIIFSEGHDHGMLFPSATSPAQHLIALVADEFNIPVHDVVGVSLRPELLQLALERDPDFDASAVIGQLAHVTLAAAGHEVWLAGQDGRIEVPMEVYQAGQEVAVSVDTTVETLFDHLLAFHEHFAELAWARGEERAGDIVDEEFRRAMAVLVPISNEQAAKKLKQVLSGEAYRPYGLSVSGRLHTPAIAPATMDDMLLVPRSPPEPLDPDASASTGDHDEELRERNAATVAPLLPGRTEHPEAPSLPDPAGCAGGGFGSVGAGTLLPPDGGSSAMSPCGLDIRGEAGTSCVTTVGAEIHASSAGCDEPQTLPEGGGLCTSVETGAARSSAVPACLLDPEVTASTTQVHGEDRPLPEPVDPLPAPAAVLPSTVLDEAAATPPGRDGDGDDEPDSGLEPQVDPRYALSYTETDIYREDHPEEFRVPEAQPQPQPEPEINFNGTGRIEPVDPGVARPMTKPADPSRGPQVVQGGGFGFLVD